MGEVLTLEPQVKKGLSKLAQSAEECGLVLFVGAGINGGRYRQWRGLVKKLLADGLRTCTNNRQLIDQLVSDLEKEWDFYALASLAKLLLGKRYTEVLRENVYEPISEEPTQIADVAEFCRLPWIRAVVTYNYDMFLETAYENLPNPDNFRKMMAIGLRTRDAHVTGENVIPVFHVHGLLASPDELYKTADDPVVLSYDEYTESTRDTFSWGAATQMHFLRSHTCLFLGTSVTDWSILRILQAAHEPSEDTQHWLLLRDASFDTAPDSQDHLLLDAKATLLESVGIRLLAVGSTYAHIYAALHHITSLKSSNGRS